MKISEQIYMLNYRRMPINELREIAIKNKKEGKIFEKFDEKIIRTFTKRQLINILELEAKYKIVKGEAI